MDVAFNSSPKTVDDLFTGAGLTEDAFAPTMLDVLANDAAKRAWIYSLDDGTSSGGIKPANLLIQDNTARTASAGTVCSANGALIWSTASGKVGYEAGTLSAAFWEPLHNLRAGRLFTDSFAYAIQRGGSSLKRATASVQVVGVDDVPVLAATTMRPADVAALANASAQDIAAIGRSRSVRGADIGDCLLSTPPLPRKIPVRATLRPILKHGLANPYLRAPGSQFPTVSLLPSTTRRVKQVTQ